MTSPSCRVSLSVLAALAVSIAAVSGAQARAPQCRGEKIVQNCTAYHADGTWWVSNTSIPPAYTTCQPLRVPCDYPENIFELLDRVFPSSN